MTFNVNTKFNIGDTIYFCAGGSVHKEKIIAAHVWQWRDEPIHITYTVSDFTSNVNEDDAFATQEELFAHIAYKED